MEVEFKKIVKELGLSDEQVTGVKDFFVQLVKQESFYDPDTRERTFYTDQLVDRIKKLPQN